MTTELDNIISKVKKLLALAGNNPNEAEAAAATAKASALMAEYNLSTAQVKADTTGNQRIEDATGKSKVSDQWEKHIWYATAELNFCKYWWSRWQGQKTVTHNLIGTQANVASTKVMAEYLIQTVTRLATEQPINKAQWPAFKLGASSRLSQRLRDLKRQRMAGQEPAQTGTNLPALANLYKVHETDNDAYFKEQHPLTTLGKAKKTRFTKDMTAYSLGVRAADGIGLDQQMRANKQGMIR